MSRFTLELTLVDKHREAQPLHMAVDLDEYVRISPRDVEAIKTGLGTFDGTINLMKQRSFRKDLFIHAAKQLGALLAERMEDAEGWHDASRIEPARQQLGGRWEP